MAAFVGPSRVLTDASSALAFVLAALIAIDAPASAQTYAEAADGVSTAPGEPGPTGDAPIAVLPQPSEAVLVAVDVAVAGSPAEAVIHPRLPPTFDVPVTNEVLPGPDPAADALSPDDERTPGDPLERTNRGFFKTQSSIDRRFFRPVAQAYERDIPKPVRSGLRNFLRNLSEPIVFVNDLLQLRPGRALRTLGRFTINSTVGLGGTIDVAKKLDLPYRSNGFGNTLGRYGVGPGPYLYLPLIGPTTLRDLLGGQIDGLTLPVGVGFPFDRLDYQLSSTVVSTLDKRAEAESDLQALLNGAADPYATLRSVYLQSREAAIADVRGRSIELAPLDDPLADPAGQATDPAAEQPHEELEADVATNPAATPDDPADTLPEPQPAPIPDGL